MNDPYSILGLPPSATKEEVKSAFRKHALRHHPDHHVNSPEAVKIHAENQFKIIKAAYELITDGNYRYRDAGSPGRAGFRRSATNPYSQHSYSSSYYAGDASYGGYTHPRYQNFTQRAAAEARSHWRAFTSSGSAALTAGLAGIFLGGVLFMGPVFSAFWERKNEGKLFKHIEDDVMARTRAQLAELRAARERREHEAAAMAAAAVEVSSPAIDERSSFIPVGNDENSREDVLSTAAVVDGDGRTPDNSNEGAA